MKDTDLPAVLTKMGYDTGWAANAYRIILWERDEPQPTEAELTAAGWIKPKGETEE